MFERFSQSARVAVVLAQEEARMLGDQWIGTEHVLIGLAGAGSDPAALALAAANVTGTEIRSRLRSSPGDDLDPAALALVGIDLDQVRRAAEERFGVGALDPLPKGRSPKGHIPFAAGTKKALELAVRAAFAHRTDSISTGHLLIGIIDEGHGRGVRVLSECGVDLPRLRADTIVRLGSEAA